jgi:Transglycosylase-like domain
MRSRALVVLAVAVAVVPAVAQAAESAADGDPGLATHARPHAQALRATVTRLERVVGLLSRVRRAERPLSATVPHYEAFTCIAEHESGGRWDISTGNGYYGGLQMDRQFQQTYAPGLYRVKGTADNWTREEQMRAAARAVRSRGFSPWSTTASMCGLL